MAINFYGDIPNFRDLYNDVQDRKTEFEKFIAKNFNPSEKLWRKTFSLSDIYLRHESDVVLIGADGIEEKFIVPYEIVSNAINKAHTSGIDGYKYIIDRCINEGFFFYPVEELIYEISLVY